MDLGGSQSMKPNEGFAQPMVPQISRAKSQFKDTFDADKKPESSEVNSKSTKQASTAPGSKVRAENGGADSFLKPPK